MHLRLIILFLFMAGCGGTSKTDRPTLQSAPPAKADHPAWLPDLTLTPGGTEFGWKKSDTTAPGGTQAGRSKMNHSLKRRVWIRYGYDQTIGPYEDHAGEFEIDHLIPNALGGSSTVENLWPQPYTGPWNAHIKDRLEMHVRSLVLSGKMSLKDAQDCFIPDWTVTFKNMGLDKSSATPDEANPDDLQ